MSAAWQGFLRGVGVVGPGVSGFDAGRALLAAGLDGAARTVIPAPQRLPAAERRRAGAAVKLALASADEAVAMAGVDPAVLRTVFTSSNGDGANCHAVCESLAMPERLISPTRFTNSVHNAPAGYWHIAVAGRAASTSLCGHDASFVAGLAEAALQLREDASAPLLLVASDAEYPQPLAGARPMVDSFGAAFVLDGAASDGAVAALTLELRHGGERRSSTCASPAAEALRASNPAARALPWLESLAAGREAVLVFAWQPGLDLVLHSRPLA